MREQIFTASDGQKLVCSLWDRVTGTPRGVVQIIHDRTRHIEPYDRFAQFLNKNGFIVWKNASSPNRPNEDPVASSVSDELEILDYLRGCFNLPIILFGHGYAGFIAQFMISQTRAHSGVCLSGTGRYPRVMLRLGHTMATLGRWIFGANAPVRAWKYIPLIQSSNSYGFYQSLFKNLLRLRYCANPDIPLLIMVGDADPIDGYARYAFALYETYVMRVRNSTLDVYPDARHELLMEPNYADIQNDFLNFAIQACKNAHTINRCVIQLSEWS